MPLERLPHRVGAGRSVGKVTQFRSNDCEQENRFLGENWEEKMNLSSFFITFCCYRCCREKKRRHVLHRRVWAVGTTCKDRNGMMWLNRNAVFIRGTCHVISFTFFFFFFFFPSCRLRCLWRSRLGETRRPVRSLAPALSFFYSIFNPLI